jgi:branched-chain amino acid transport system substrate-binding protein
MRIGRDRRQFIVGAGALALGCPAVVRAQQASGEPYKIGVTYPLSGPQGAWGQLIVPAIEIAVQHANAAGGVNGRPLSLVVEDSKGNPEAAVSAMRKVVQVDGVQAILTIFTNVVSAQMPLAQQLKVPLISPVEAPGLTAKSGGWVFAHSSLLSRNLPPLEAYWKQKGVKKLFCFLPNTPIAPYGSGQFKEAAQRLGASYEEVLYKLGDTDFRGLIVRARAFAPDAIVIFGHGTPDEGLIMKQARELGVTTQIYTPSATPTVKSYREAAGKAIEGVIYSGFKYDPAAAKPLIDAYRAKLGFDPDFAALEVYDMINMVAGGIKANGYTGEGIRKHIAELKDFKSIGGGLVTMDSEGQTLNPVGMYIVRDAVKPTFEEIKS